MEASHVQLTWNKMVLLIPERGLDSADTVSLDYIAFAACSQYVYGGVEMVVAQGCD